jgi:diacylglycerol O-acyltransferase
MGGRVREIYPFVPLSPQGHALSIGVLSYDNQVFFGLVGDRDLVPDLDELAAAIDEAVEEQLEAGRKPTPKKRKPAAKKRKRGAAKRKRPRARSG